MLSIRPSTPGDTAALARLISELGYPVDETELSPRLARLTSAHHTLVAELSGEVAGFIGLAVFPFYELGAPVGYILAFSVGGRHRRQGIGKALLDAAEEHFRAAGVADIRVNSGLHREEAHRFYESRGYRKTGFRFRKEL